VGAAFDFHAGTARMAPPWMQDAGLEWFYRLCQEPRRLWRRYLFNNARFLRLCLQRSIQGKWSDGGGPSNEISRRRASATMAEPQAVRCDPPHRSAPGRPALAPPVSVVTPLYNERECVDMLIASLDRFEQALSDQFELEFLLVDDGSTDDTAALLQSAIEGRGNYQIVRHERNRGIAAAIQTGIRAARHEIVVSTDCDGSYDPMLIGELVARLEPGVDLVTASPYHRDGRVENVPKWRLALSRLASRMYGAACRHKLSCYTSCFRVYRRSAIAPIELENERFVGVAELLWKVLDRGGKVVEHPALLRSRVAGQSKMRIVRATLGHLRLIGKIAGTRLRPKRNSNPVTPRSSEGSG
jgi:cellulose synthase/poly-beta-1,6-N-acetylglucosamine synthase-like glycosyltransferase